MLKKLSSAPRLFSLYVPVLIAVVYLGFAIGSMQYDDVTFDESPHLRYGIQIIKGKADRLIPGEDRFGSTMPVTALNAIPRGMEQIMHPGMKKDDWGEADIKHGRYITIAVSLLLLFYCFRFAAAITSNITGCIILLLLACDPNILAHARLVTTDMYGTIAFVAVIYHLWQWLAGRNYSHFYYWCVAIAIAQCCKPNNVLLYPICFLPILLYGIQSRPLFRITVLHLLLFALIQMIVINACFLFSTPWGQSLSEMPLKSDFFRHLQGTWLGKLPVPFVNAFVEGFDLVQHEREKFAGTANNYLLGEIRYQRGFWNYYLVCFALKTPVVSMALMIVGIVSAMLSKKIRKAVLLFGFWPCCLLFIFLSSSSVQNGYRYLLPAVCLLLIFTAPFVQLLVNKFPGWAVVSFTAAGLGTAVFSFPNYIAYTNLLLGDKRLAYRYFADSNLNWGQRHVFIKSYLLQHPYYKFEPALPTTGMLLVDINNLAGIWEPGKFRWLREHYQPIASVDKCYLLYNIQQLPPLK